MVLLDNGDINKGYGRQPELKYETAMRAMAEMGYVAANVGEQDLVLGVDYLKYVSDYTGVPLLSANIVDVEGEPVFEQFAMRELQDGDRPATVAAVGVISTEFADETEATSPESIPPLRSTPSSTSDINCRLTAASNKLPYPVAASERP